MRKKKTTKKITTPKIICTSPWRLAEVKPRKDFILKVKFVDGTKGFVELQNLILSKRAGVFKKLKNKTFFKKVHLELGVATWPGEIDLPPDVLYDAIKKQGRCVLK